MSEYLPGATFLGMSFNTYETYDDSSGMDQMFDTTWTSNTWTDPESGITYVLPENASLNTAVASSEGVLETYQNKTSFEESFSTKADVDASYGFFTGQFSASYSTTTKVDSEYQYAMMQTTARYWTLTMEDQSENALASWVKEDPDFQDLPDTYNDETQDVFFRFFDKYGAYYVVAVTLGGRLYYSTSVDKTYNYSEQEIKTNVEAEYKAVWEVSAEAEAEWTEIGEEWAEERVVTVAATGGNSDLLNALAPGYGDNFSADFATWNESTRTLPGIVELTLKPMSRLFSGDKAEATSEAIAAWEASKIIAESKSDACSISVGGSLALPPAEGENSFGFQLVAVDRENQTQAFAKSYATTDAYGEMPDYEQALADIAPYRSERYWIAFATWSQLGYTVPTPDFYDFLIDCGAGEGLDTWLSADQANQTGNSGADVYYCELFHCNYVLIGIPSAGKNWAAVNNLESFERAGSCDTGTTTNPYPNQAKEPAPNASVVANAYYHLDESYAMADGRRMGPSYAEHAASVCATRS